MKILEFVVIFIAPLLLFGAAFHQLGKKAGEVRQNIFQIIVYGGSLALGAWLVTNGLSARRTYLVVAPLAFFFSFCLELTYLAGEGEKDRSCKIVGVLMFTHMLLTIIFLSLSAIGT